MVLSIFNLPADIIFSIVDAIDEFKDRRKFLQVCRDWRSLLLTKVYSRVRLDEDEGLIPLAHIIHINPSIRSTIQELRAPILFYGDEKLYRRLASSYGPVLLRELIKPFPMTLDDQDYLDDFIDDDYAHVEELWFLVVILYLENLRYLETCHYSYLNWDLTIQILERLISTPGHTALKHLEEVNILSERTSQNFDAAKFATFFKIPSMRVFRAALHEEHEDWYPTRSYPGLHPRPKPSPIRQIILKNSNCAFGMVEYISLCANLEYFEYQHTNSVEDGEKRLYFRPRPFRTALLTQKHSLRVLRLNDCGATKGVDDVGPDEEAIFTRDDEGIERLFGSLVEFTELRELRIPVRNLLDLGRRRNGNRLAWSLDKILPHSLEYLCLARTDQAEFDLVNSELRSLVAIHSHRFPCFRKLVIQLYQLELIPGETLTWRDDEAKCRIPSATKEAFEDVRKMCEAKCIEFSFAHDGEYQILAESRLIHDTRVMPYCSHMI